MVQRWRQLPLDHALSCVPAVRALLDELALLPTSPGKDTSGAVVPDLGPAVLMDQLAVLVYDACLAGVASADLTGRLVDLRRTLA